MQKKNIKEYIYIYIKLKKTKVNITYQIKREIKFKQKNGQFIENK